MSNLNVAVIGQGYVGLPLALAAAESGNNVLGIDSDLSRVNAISSGRSPVEDISSQSLRDKLHSGFYSVSSDFSKLKDIDVILICVPTPIDSNFLPDLRALNSCIENISKFIKPGILVVLESTVAPGSTRDSVFNKLIELTGFKHDDIDVAFSPERIDPSNKQWNISNTPKLLAGLTASACKRAQAFYEDFISEVHIFESVEVVETAKLLENSFRLVNISFINEMSIFCEKIGIDVGDVISAASTKPYGFMPFYPSIGIGGHCIPVDPLYLLAKSSQVDAPAKFIELAHKINEERPLHFVEAAVRKLGSLQSKRIIIVGISYKPNVSDMRETPAIKLILELRSKGAIVDWCDPLVKTWNGENSADLNSDYDLAILANVHDVIDLSPLGEVPTIDSRMSRK